MKTPKTYIENIQKHIITEDMLGACLYSVNKRAKNYRDNLQGLYAELDYLRDIYGPNGTRYQWKSINSAKATMDEYYHIKDQLLRLVAPTCIHTETDPDSPDVTRYYLYYKVGAYSFHRPIKKRKLRNHPDLQKEEIGTLITHGHEIDDLVSIQFVRKVLATILSGDFTYEAA